MVITKVFQETTYADLEDSINSWLFNNGKIYTDDDVEIVITGDSDTNKWVALLKIKKITKKTVENNKYVSPGNADGFRYTVP